MKDIVVELNKMTKKHKDMEKCLMDLGHGLTAVAEDLHGHLLENPEDIVIKKTRDNLIGATHLIIKALRGEQ